MKDVISDALSSAYPRNWDEDFITRDILRELRNNYKDVEITQDKVLKKRPVYLGIYSRTPKKVELNKSMEILAF